MVVTESHAPNLCFGLASALLLLLCHGHALCRIDNAAQWQNTLSNTWCNGWELLVIMYIDETQEWTPRLHEDIRENKCHADINTKVTEARVLGVGVGFEPALPRAAG